MDSRLSAVFAEQEKEDAYRLTEGLEPAMREEFGNAPYLIEQVRKQRLHDVTDALAFSIRETIVRVSAEFSIRKHTTCQIPYYHGHDFYEMIYVWRGSCGQRIAGEREELWLTEGDLCILTPGMVHAMQPCRETDLILKMILPNPRMRKLLNALTEAPLAGLLADRNRIFLFRGTPGTRFPIRRRVEELLCETYWGGEFRDPAIDSLLVLLLIALGRGVPEPAEETVLQKVTAYIRDHIREASLEECAKQTGYSSRQLRRRIAEASGGTFSDILWRMRIEKAAELLNEAEASVEDVARLVGYRGMAGFYRRFQEVFHMTPAAYRRMYRVGE